MKALTDLLAQIPALFWGVIAGGLISLGTTVLTNRAHDRRLQQQLIHERDLTNRERELSLRREVYLAATEGIAAGLIAVSRFPNLEIQNEKVTEGFQDKAPSITKVNVIAIEATVRALVNFSGELSATFLRLFAKRVPLLVLKQQIALLRAQIDVSLKESSRTIELMKQHNIEGLSDHHKWETLQGHFEFERNRQEQADLQATTLEATLCSKQLQYTEECFSELDKLGRLLIPLLFSVRRELELPIDETEFLRISEEGLSKQIESRKEFMRQIQAMIPNPPPTLDSPPPASHS